MKSKASAKVEVSSAADDPKKEASAANGQDRLTQTKPKPKLPHA